MLKKAVAPLIAMVLLTLLAISLGAVVITFTNKVNADFIAIATDNIDQGIQCTMDLEVGVLYANNQYIACYNRTGSHNLEFALENRASTDLDGIRVIIVGDDDSIAQAKTTYGVPAHQTAQFNLSVGQSFSYPIAQVIFTPIVRNDILCANREFALSNINSC